jgi:hypothetical protein
VLGGLARRAVGASLAGVAFDVTNHEYWILRRALRDGGAHWEALVIAAGEALGRRYPYPSVAVKVVDKPVALV